MGYQIKRIVQHFTRSQRVILFRKRKIENQFYTPLRMFHTSPRKLLFTKNIQWEYRVSINVFCLNQNLFWKYFKLRGSLLWSNIIDWLYHAISDNINVINNFKNVFLLYFYITSIELLNPQIETNIGLSYFLINKTFAPSNAFS